MEHFAAVLLRNDAPAAEAVCMWAHGDGSEAALDALRALYFGMLDSASGGEDPELVADWDRMVQENENGDEPAGDFTIRLLGTFR